MGQDLPLLKRVMYDQPRFANQIELDAEYEEGDMDEDYVPV